MNRFSLFIAVFCLLSVSVIYASDENLYVAVNGNDNWSGTLASPNKSKTDGPFATIERAKSEVSHLRTLKIYRREPITVILRKGTYFLNEPLVFTYRDSGTPESPTIYKAYNDENPIISGGRRLAGWTKVSGNTWQTAIPGAVEKNMYFAQLFVNGVRRYRTRLPESGYYFIKDAADSSPKAQGIGFDRFVFNDGEIDKNWANLQNVEIIPFHTWTSSRFPIQNIDAGNTVTLKGNTASTVWWASMPKGNRYCIENVKEALDKPGEWYYDRGRGVISYIPLKGENLEKAEIIIPYINDPIQLKGDSGRLVSDLRFEGISFMHGNWTMPEAGHSFPQAEVNMKGLVNLESAYNIVFEDCTIAHTGAYGIDIGSTCRNIIISDCEIVDLGAGGIKIGESVFRDDRNLVSSHITVRNNVIAHGGRLHPAGVGLIICHSPYNKIQNNTIFDFYYSGMNVGWSWGYGNSNAHHNLIENNHVYQIGQGVLSDMGGIYTLGISEGSIIRHNLFHDIVSYGYGGWGIYLDEGTTHMLVENNIVYNTKTGGFHQHYGKENVITNNIFALSDNGQIIRTRSEEHLSFTFEKNIVYWLRSPLLGSNWSSNNYKLDYNTYWNPNLKEFKFADYTLDEWHGKGQDNNSIIADPMFKDPKNGNFEMYEDSPAFKTGFKTIDLNFGSVDVKRRVSDKSIKNPPFQLINQDNGINENFDDLRPGDDIPNLQISSESEDAAIEISSEQSVSGENSLKFTDKPGQKYNFNPHAFYVPEINNGKVEGSFNLFLKPNAVFYHEWRSMNNPYDVGPSVHISNGSLVVNDKELMRIPAEQWVNIKISCQLAGKNIGKFDLSVTLKDKKQKVFRKLDCSPMFISLRWLGFVSDGESDSSFYIDDIKLSAK